MKFVVQALATLVAWLLPSVANAAELNQSSPTIAERYRTAMQNARWTGSMLSSNAETLPKGHAYTEPYFFDVMTGGRHYPGTTGFYNYGLLDGFTIGLQPYFGYDTSRSHRGMKVGDLKLLSQLRLTRFTPEHRSPTVAVVLQEVIPTGKHDRLDPGEDGNGTGSFATEVGLNAQQYFLLDNGRLLRARVNIVQRFPHYTDVEDRSVYGTDAGFRGRAKPGARTTLIGAVEYSLTREWVLAFDIIGEVNGKTRLKGRDGDGTPVSRKFPSSHYVGFAPAIEYNWSDRTGVLFGVRVIPKGHNTPGSVTPAVAYSRFW